MGVGDDDDDVSAVQATTTTSLGTDPARPLVRTIGSTHVSGFQRPFLLLLDAHRLVCPPRHPAIRIANPQVFAIYVDKSPVHDYLGIARPTADAQGRFQQRLTQAGMGNGNGNGNGN